MEELGCFVPISAGTVFYSFLNIICRLTVDAPLYMDRKARHDYIGQHVSLFHSIQAITLCIISYIYSNGIDLAAQTDYLQIWTLGFSIGYFIYDFIYAEIYKLHDWPMRIHHLFVIAGGCCLLLQPMAGALGPVCLFLTELSNPFLEIRLILKGQKKQDSSFYKAMELLFAVVFILNRGIFGTIINYNVYQYDLPWLLKFMVSGVYGVSFYWIYVIFSMVFRDAKKEIQTSLCKSSCIKILNCIKRNQILFGVGICLWSLMVPITFKVADFPPIHAEYNGFKII